MDVNVAIMRTLADKWKKDKLESPINANRIFVRWTCWSQDEDEQGWDDWALVGLLNEDKSITWLRENDSESEIATHVTAAVTQGMRLGKIETDTIFVQFGIFNGDGPDTKRVSDWVGT